MFAVAIFHVLNDYSNKLVQIMIVTAHNAHI